jgi:hypothetical protein
MTLLPDQIRRAEHDGNDHARPQISGSKHPSGPDDGKRHE